MDPEEIDIDERQEARNKLKERFGQNARTGGKGSMRRKKKVVTKTNKNEDKRILNAVRKYGLQPLQEIDEINMFKDDNTVIHFKKPSVQFAVKESFLLISGTSETKEIRELLPGIINQVGPQQYEYLKKFANLLQTEKNKPTEEQDEEDDEDIPELVGTNFEEVSKKD